LPSTDFWRKRRAALITGPSAIYFFTRWEMDAIADIVAVCMLMEELAPEQVLSSRSMWAAARCAAPTGSCRCPPRRQHIF
jgi:uncharacterized protein (DUF111 family)